MQPIRSGIRLFAWIASFAILASAFAPTITRLLADVAGDAVMLAQICSVEGETSVRVAAGIDGGQAPQPAHGNPLAGAADCPYCLPHALSLAPPPAAASFAAVPRLSAGPPLRFLASPTPLFAWIAAAPRGPPRAS